MVASEREGTIAINDVHLFTADVYLKMIETGILTKEERVELIGGVIVLSDRYAPIWSMNC